MITTMNDYTYRRALESDLPAICVLGQVVNLLHHEARPEIFAPLSAPERDEEHWRSTAFSSGSIAFVAEYSGQTIAFVTASVIDENHSLLQPIRYVRVGSVCVDEGQRGRGVGRELMQLVERWAAREGASDIRLNVWAFNESARHLYKELGYEVRSLFLGKWIVKNGAASSTSNDGYKAV